MEPVKLADMSMQSSISDLSLVIKNQIKIVFSDRKKVVHDCNEHKEIVHVPGLAALKCLLICENFSAKLA